MRYTFAEAINAIRTSGKKLRREQWRPGKYVCFWEPEDRAPHLEIVDINGARGAYTPSQCDMFATDWVEAPTTVDVRPLSFDLVAHIRRQRSWSETTCGPRSRSCGVVKHIRKELCEIEAKPDDLEEWIDVMILAMDGAWRAGYEPEEIVAALAAKQTKNEARKWPDWRTVPEGAPIEHDRSGE